MHYNFAKLHKTLQGHASDGERAYRITFGALMDNRSAICLEDTMPTENETKPCTHKGCKGTMKYSAKARPPGWGAGVGGDEDRSFGVAMSSQVGSAQKTGTTFDLRFQTETLPIARVMCAAFA